MGNWPFQEIARFLVMQYIQSHLEKTDKHVGFTQDNVYVVWACYILGNSKVLISTTLPDGMYYEVTHDVEKDKYYIDAYKKWENVELTLGEDGWPTADTIRRGEEA